MQDVKMVEQCGLVMAIHCIHFISNDSKQSWKCS